LNNVTTAVYQERVRWVSAQGTEEHEIPVTPNMTVGQFLAECQTAFGLNASVWKDRLVTFLITADGQHSFPAGEALPLSQGQGFRLEVYLALPLKILGWFLTPGNIPTPYFHEEERFLVPWQDAVKPTELWIWFLSSKSETERSQMPPLTEMIVFIGTRGEPEEIRPLLQGYEADTPPRYCDLKLEPNEQIVLMVRYAYLTVRTPFDTQYLTIDTINAWGNLLPQMIAAASDAFRRTSSVAALRLGNRWVTDMERPIYWDVHGVKEISLHPIVGCLIFMLSQGQLQHFVARLPADLPIQQLLPDLQRQVETQLGLVWPGETVELASYIPLSLGSSLPSSSLGIDPAKRLLDMSPPVQNGWAILLLMKKQTLTGIIEPTLPEQSGSSDVGRLSPAAAMLPQAGATP
jgi:hypothetical protein